MKEHNGHLRRAKEFIVVAESVDSRTEAYRLAGEEILEARRIDPGLTLRAIGSEIGKSESWVSKLTSWVENLADPQAPSTPFGGTEENEARYQRHDRRRVAEVVAERPEAIAEAVAAASPEAQRKIAQAIVSSGTADDSLVAAVSPPPLKPRQARPAWRRLSDATFALWEVGQELMDKVPADEERVRMISSAEKAERLAAGISLLLNTGEMDEAFRDLLAEVEVEA